MYNVQNNWTTYYFGVFGIVIKQDAEQWLHWLFANEQEMAIKKYQ